MQLFPFLILSAITLVATVVIFLKIQRSNELRKERLAQAEKTCAEFLERTGGSLNPRPIGPYLKRESSSPQKEEGKPVSEPVPKYHPMLPYRIRHLEGSIVYDETALLKPINFPATITPLHYHLRLISVQFLHWLMLIGPVYRSVGEDIGLVSRAMRGFGEGSVPVELLTPAYYGLELVLQSPASLKIKGRAYFTQYLDSIITEIEEVDKLPEKVPFDIEKIKEESDRRLIPVFTLVSSFINDETCNFILFSPTEEERGFIRIINTREVEDVTIQVTHTVRIFSYP